MPISICLEVASTWKGHMRRASTAAMAKQLEHEIVASYITMTIHISTYYIEARTAIADVAAARTADQVSTHCHTNWTPCQSAQAAAHPNGCRMYINNFENWGNTGQTIKHITKQLIND